MSFWPLNIDINTALLLLPEPIMIVGNKSPDGDSAGCIAALLDHLRNQGREAYAHFAVRPEPDLAWIFTEEDENPTIMEDYEGLIVVDDYVNGERLGITLKDVPTVNIDHHSTNRPPVIETGSGAMEVYTEKNLIRFWANVPATACLLIASNILHPFLWISMFTDTVGFTVSGADAIRYTSILMDGLENVGDPLTNELQETIYQNYNRIGSLDAFNTFMNARIDTFVGRFNGEPIQVVIGQIDTDDKLTAYKSLGTFRAYGHIAVVMNKRNGLTSLRSRSSDFDVCAIAKLFGGGGHVRAAGCSLSVERFAEESDRLIAAIINQLTDVKQKSYL